MASYGISAFKCSLYSSHEEFPQQQQKHVKCIIYSQPGLTKVELSNRFLEEGTRESIIGSGIVAGGQISSTL